MSVRFVWEFLYAVVGFGACLCCLGGGSISLCVLFVDSCVLLYGVACLWCLCVCSVCVCVFRVRCFV